MSVAAYRRLRIIVGTLVLAFSALAFADVGDWMWAHTIRRGLWAQFAPSFLGLLQGITWISAGCLAVLVLTLVFGRIYCAMLCPLGVLMDLSAWLARRSGKRRKLPYRPGRPWLRASVVFISGAALLAGTAVPLGLLDPYSLFGKITAATLRPALAESNHLLAASGWFDPVKTSPVALTTFMFSITLLTIVISVAVLRGRLWCNTLCPVGAVLGFVSRHSIFRLKIADSACVGCSMCERVCPAQCIDFRNHRIDHSRCVMCLDCVTSCRRSGIHLSREKWHGRPGRSPQPETSMITAGGAPSARAMPSIHRRTFLTAAAALPAVALAGQGGGSAKPPRPRPVLPPGAKSLAHFQSRCTACHLCVANCPEQVLRPSVTAHGLAGFLQPYQDFNVSFCSYNCSNCSHICPTGAIQPITVDERRTVQAGVARFNPDLCVVKTKGTSCGACNEHCPTQAVHMVPWEKNLTIPEVDTELCIGCGGCEYICPVRPQRAIVVDGLPVHARANPVDRGMDNTVREIEEEFPF